MPSGVYKRSEEYKRKVSETNKRLGIRPPVLVGRPAWNKGLRGCINSGSFKEGHRGYKAMLGKHPSEETRKKISIAGMNMKWTEEDKLKLRGKRPNFTGEKCHSWRGGISKEFARYNRERRVREYEAEGSHGQSEWESLKAQYNWTCPACKISEPEIKLTEDHIVPLSRGGSDNIKNIQPLCVSCNSRKNVKVIKYEFTTTSI